MRLLGTLRFHLRVPSLHGSHRDLTKMRIEIEIWGDFCEINDIYSAAAITVMNAKSWWKTTACTLETVLILLSLFQSDVPFGLHPQNNRLYLGDSPSHITVSISEWCTYWATSPKTTVSTSETRSSTWPVTPCCSRSSSIRQLWWGGTLRQPTRCYPQSHGNRGHEWRTSWRSR